MLPRREASYRGLIRGLEFWRAERAADPDSRTLADAHVPDGFAMARDLPEKVWWTGAGHRGH
jgi:hypothetical protein